MPTTYSQATYTPIKTQQPAHLSLPIAEQPNVINYLFEILLLLLLLISITNNNIVLKPLKYRY